MCKKRNRPLLDDAAREILIPKNLSAWFGMYLPAMPIIFNFGRQTPEKSIKSKMHMIFKLPFLLKIMYNIIKGKLKNL